MSTPNIRLFLQNLRCDLPYPIMQLPDFPIVSPEEEPAYQGPYFLPHDYVLKYVRDIASHFDLEKRIRLATEVKKVEPIRSESVD